MTRKGKEDTGELLVSIEQFTRTRDSVIISLTNLQSSLTHVQHGLSELLGAYITHTASIIAGEGGTLDSLQLPPQIAANANAAIEAAHSAGNSLAQAVNATAPVDAGKKKRKREKKEKDPNAPKRPLTAAFLYAQAARPIVRQDLEGQLEPGHKLEPNAVNLEVTKRWNEMDEDHKEQWRASYRNSLEQYKEDVKAYVASSGDAAAAIDLHEDEEASDEAEAGALDSDASNDSEDDAVAPTPISKAASPPAGKTPRPNKRQKTTQAPQANGSSNGTLQPIAPAPPAATPVPVPGAKPVTQILPASSSIEATTPAAAKSRPNNKKKTNAAATPIAINTKEPSPDDPKKKTTAKNGRSTRNADVEMEEAPVTAVKKRNPKRKSEGAA